MSQTKVRDPLPTSNVMDLMVLWLDNIDAVVNINMILLVWNCQGLVI